MNHVIFNGTDLTTLGLYVSGDKTFNSPEKNYTKVSIPGRSGDLYISDGTYKNVKLSYDSIIIPPSGQSFSQASANIRNFLLSSDGYGRIEDDYNPDEYRMGVYSGPMDFTVYRLGAGKAKLEFNCMPQRWLKTGETEVSISNNGTITNPTLNAAKPLLKVYGNGGNDTEITVAGTSLTLKKRSADAYIDCETMDCYIYVNGVKTPRNDLLIVPNEFITLPPGTSTFTLNPTSAIKVTPRWFIL